MTFWVSPGINSDHMEVVNGRVCRTIDLAAATNAIRAPLTDSGRVANLMDKVLFGTSEIISDFPPLGQLTGIHED
jgi:hypothetical protein